jgi:AsmA protein
MVGIIVGLVVVLLVAGVGVLYVLFDGDKIKSEISRVVLEKTQRKLVMTGTPKLSVWPDVGISLQGVTLSEHASDATFLSLDAARVSVAVMPLLSRQVKVRALEVDGLNATFIKHKDGSLNIADLISQDAAKADSKPAQDASEPLQINVKSMRLTHAQLNWRDDQAGTRTDISNLSISTGAVQADASSQTASIDRLLLTMVGKAGTDAFELKLDAPRLNLAQKQSSSEALTLTASLSGAARSATVNLSLSGVQGNAKQLHIASLVIALDAKAGDSSVKGQLSSPVAVNVANQAVSLSKLAGNLELANPAMPMKQVTLPVQGALQFNGKAKTAALDLSTQFDESRILTSIKVNQFSPLAVVFDLDIDRLNIDKYLPPKPAGATGKSAGGAAPQDVPIDLSALKGHTVSGAVHIGALQVSNLKLDKINARINLAGGKLDVAPLSLNLYQGSANGSVSANANSNVIALKQTLAGISINPLMKDLANKDLLEGRGNVALDVRARGPTVGALKKALVGTASLSLKDGAIKGINLAQTLRDAKAKLGRADSTQAANARQKTDFSELTASFRLANGVAHNDDLVMKSPYIRLGGTGDFDVGGGQMNYLAKATVVNSDIGQGGADLSQLKGLTVPVRVTGPFESLSYKIEWEAMLEDATKAKVDEKKAELKAKVDEKVKDTKTKAEDALKDKARDALKGLFGR